MELAVAEVREIVEGAIFFLSQTGGGDPEFGSLVEESGDENS